MRDVPSLSPNWEIDGSKVVACLYKAFALLVTVEVEKTVDVSLEMVEVSLATLLPVDIPLVTCLHSKKHTVTEGCFFGSRQPAHSF